MLSRETCVSKGAEPGKRKVCLGTKQFIESGVQSNNNKCHWKGGWGPNRLKFLEVTGGSGKSLKFLEAVLRGGACWLPFIPQWQAARFGMGGELGAGTLLGHYCTVFAYTQEDRK